MQFGLWRTAAFVSSPIHLLQIVYNSCTGTTLSGRFNVNCKAITVVFSATNHDFRLSSRFVWARPREADQGGRGWWPAGLGRYAGRLRVRAPASGRIWRREAFISWQRSGIPVSADSAPWRSRLSARHTWMSSSRISEHASHAQTDWIKEENERRIREKGREWSPHTNFLSYRWRS